MSDESNIVDLPFFKDGATVQERLAEVCRAVELRPEVYQKVALVYVGSKGVNWVSAGCSPDESATLLSIATMHAVRCAEIKYDEEGGE